jgi:hypothetical protein
LTYGCLPLSILFVDVKVIREIYVRPDAVGCPGRCSVCYFV